MINYSTEKYTAYDYQDICKGAEGHDLPVNVYLPAVENDRNSTAVICIHGGSWQSNLKQDVEWNGSWMKHNASVFASIGYTAIEITYRSITETGINGIISDVEAIFCHIRDNLKTKHGIKHIYAVGDSAGGHLALMSAIFADTTLRPEKVAACNPVSDLTDPKWQLYSTTEEERRTASPMYRNDTTESKILILHGDADRTVNVACSERLNAHLNGIGSNCSFEAFPSATHAFILYGYKTPTEQVDRYMEKIIEFFDSTM